MKYKWKVSEKPTGRYSSFEKRMWPEACYLNERESPAAQIYCDDSYEPWRVKEGKHGELTLLVADHSGERRKWRTIKKRFATLQEAKEAFALFIEKYPEFMPKEG